MAITTDDFYRSSNGDRWQLIRDTATGRSFVRHEPNLLSGGRTTDTDVEGPCCTDQSLGGEDWTVYQGPVPDPGQPPCRSKRTKIAVITSRSSGTE